MVEAQEARERLLRAILLAPGVAVFGLLAGGRASHRVHAITLNPPTGYRFGELTARWVGAFAFSAFFSLLPTHDFGSSERQLFAKHNDSADPVCLRMLVLPPNNYANAPEKASTGHGSALPSPFPAHRH
jgi:hypothetical protein